MLNDDAVASICARERARNAFTSWIRSSMVRVGELARSRFMAPQTGGRPASARPPSWSAR